MRRIIVGAFMSLDSVMQAPGGPNEDPSGGFRFGGWSVPYWDDTLGEAMGETFSKPVDLLLGRRTYDIFAAHWPHVDVDPSSSTFDERNHEIASMFNRITKYVATRRPESLSWENSEALGPDVVARVRELKASDGPDLLTQGSTELVRLLLANDLVDELRLLTYPVVLGQGKRLFDGSALPAAFKLTAFKASATGVVVATYQRGGEIGTGSFALENPPEAELERRRNLA